eukprot:NODE_2543_length_1093_cov_12.909962_g2114_i0.p2 GENE.NODE_2543_length_1093_cov_12.909962_g2114_i0~~NODE_2543_length_1093_cov_12.909962_g2114_i0.p2  ORF type:complete len:295 (+),score=82.60 NODE_2543_length_1093_cov_12.909962_g2114_i0:141-1025(+)
MAEAEEEKFEVVLLGGAAVGKTALVTQLVQGAFQKSYDPTIEDPYSFGLTVDGKQTVCNILDTAGQDDFAQYAPGWYDKGQGFIVVYSITDDDSFKKVASIRDSVLKAKRRPTFPIVLIGNKTDEEKDRKVTAAMGQELADNFFTNVKGPERKVPFFELTAQSKDNVTEIFSEIARRIRGDSTTEQKDVKTTGGDRKGWLKKSGGGFLKSDQKRWFVLTKDKMKYFKTEADPEPLGEFDLRNAQFIHRGATTFELVGPHLNAKKESKSYILHAEKEEDLKGWKEAIEMAAMIKD